jgi:hypothetical protein
MPKWLHVLPTSFHTEAGTSDVTSNATIMFSACINETFRLQFPSKQLQPFASTVKRCLQAAALMFGSLLYCTHPRCIHTCLYVRCFTT